MRPIMNNEQVRVLSRLDGKAEVIIMYVCRWNYGTGCENEQISLETGSQECTAKKA